VRDEEETAVDASAPTLRGIDPLERETIRRVAWRLLPLLMLGMFCSWLDRSNVGMAGPTMIPDLGFSNAVFGFGAGLFFVGYLFAEIPSCAILNMVGARRWIARILITWGIASGLTAFVWNDWTFYGVRLLIGLAEAGFFPGVVLYLTWWFPSYYRARMQGIFYSAGTISLIIGPPIGGLLLQLNGVLGLHGWQWLFVVEALPAVVMGVVTWYLLTDRPTDAAWLRPDQRTWLAERLASEQAQREAVRKYSLGEVFYNPKVWLLTLAWCGMGGANYGLAFFMPLIVKGLGVSTNMIGLVSAMPYVFALAAMLLWGWHSDRTGERTWHAAGGFLLTAAGLGACLLIGPNHPVVTVIALIFAVMGVMSTSPVFWTIPSAMLTGAAAAGGIALINAGNALGGWLGPTVFGLVKDATGNDNMALLSLALAPVISAVAVIVVGHDRRTERMPPRM
jgi:MFS family permease